MLVRNPSLGLGPSEEGEPQGGGRVSHNNNKHIMKILKQCNINNKHIMKRLKQYNIYIRTRMPPPNKNKRWTIPNVCTDITTQLTTHSSFRTMEQSDLGAFSPDCYGVVPSRVQETTAEQPPHAGVLPEA